MIPRFALSVAFVLGASSSLLAGDLSLTVLDGGLDRPQPLAGALVEVAGTASSDATGANGVATLVGVPAGAQDLLIRGPSGFGERLLRVQVPATGTLSLPAVLLSRRAASIAHVVTLSGGFVITGTSVESAGLPGSRIAIPTGTSIAGAVGDTPEFSVYPIDNVHTPVAFPPNPNPPLGTPPLIPQRLIALEPVGVQFGSGVRLRLPNTEQIATGQSQEVWGLQGGAWSQLGLATVDGTGQYMDLDVDLPGTMLLALNTTLPTTAPPVSLVVQDSTGAPVSGATVSLNGVYAADLVPGNFQFPLGMRVPARTPMRALVRVPFGPITLNYLTTPVLPNQALNRGAPVVVALSAEAGSTTPTATFANPGSGLKASDVGIGWAAGGPLTKEGTSTLAGPLALTRAPSQTSPAVSVVVDVASTSISSPTDERFLPVLVKVSDFDGASPLRVSEVQAEIFYNGHWQAVDLAPKGAGDSVSALWANEGPNEYLLVLDRHAAPEAIAYLPFPAPLSVRVSLTGEDGTTAIGSSAEVWVLDSDFAVIKSEPGVGQQGVFIDQSLYVWFADKVDPATLAGRVTLDDGTGSIPISVVATESVVRVTPLQALAAGTTHTLVIAAGVTALGGGGSTSEASSIPFKTGPGNGGLADTDGDGILDAVEQAIGTNPFEPDTDSDTVSDFRELHVHCSDPTDPTSMSMPPPVAPNDPTSSFTPPAGSALHVGDEVGPIAYGSTTESMHQRLVGTRGTQIYIQLPAPVLFKDLDLQLDLGPGLVFDEPPGGATNKAYVSYMAEYTSNEAQLDQARSQTKPPNPYDSQSSSSWTGALLTSSSNPQPLKADWALTGAYVPTPVFSAFAGTRTLSITGDNQQAPANSPPTLGYYPFGTPPVEYPLGETRIYGVLVAVDIVTEDHRALEPGAVSVEVRSQGALLGDLPVVLAAPDSGLAVDSGSLQLGGMLPADFGGVVQGVSSLGLGVNQASGEVLYSLPLFSGEGPGLPVSMGLVYRSYNSAYWRAARDFPNPGSFVYAPFGQGWASPYTIRLLPTPADRTGKTGFTYQSAQGRHYFFEEENPGSPPGERVWKANSQRSLRKSPLFGAQFRHLELKALGTTGRYELGAPHSVIRAEFDSSGRLSKLCRRDHGRPLTFDYDTPGEVKITDSQKRVTLWTLQDERVSRVLDPGGRTWSFEYTGSSLKSVRQVASKGPVRTFGYDPTSYMLTGIANDMGRSNQVEYRPPGPGSAAPTHEALPAQTVSKVTEAMAWTTFDYTRATNGAQLFATNVLGRATTIDYFGGVAFLEATTSNPSYTIEPMGANQLVGPYSSFARYDTGEGVTEHRSPASAPTSQSTTYGYDSFGRLELIHDAPTSARVSWTYEGFAIKTYGPPGPAAQSSVNVYEFVNKPNASSLVSKVTSRGSPAAITSFAYNDDGELIEAFDPIKVGLRLTRSSDSGTYGLARTASTLEIGGGTTYSTSTQQHDAMGNTIRYTSPTGDEYKYRFNNLDLLTEATGPDQSKVTVSYNQEGEVMSRTVAGGSRVLYNRDCMGLVTEVVIGGVGTTRYVRNAIGEVILVISPKGTKRAFDYEPTTGDLLRVDQENNQTTVSVVVLKRDARGNVTKIARRVADGSIPESVSEFTYDARDRITEAKAPPVTYYSTPGATSGTLHAPITKYYYYDVAAGLTDSAGVSAVLATDVEQTPQVFTRFQTRFDARDRPYKSIAFGAAGASDDFEQQLRLDDAGNVLESFLPRPLGNTTKTESTVVGLDSIGRSHTMFNTAGEQVGESGFDTSNRETQVQAADSSGMLKTILTREFEGGRLKKTTNLYGYQSTYSYDGFGRLQVVGDSLGRVATVERDAYGRTLKSTFAATDQTKTESQFKYTIYGELEEQSQVVAGNLWTTKYTYNDDGQTLSMTTPPLQTTPGGPADPQTTNYEYDALGRLSVVTAPAQAQATPPTFTRKFHYDLQDRVTQIEDPVAADSVHFRYDLRGRVTEEWNGHFRRVHTYDGHGRVLTSTLYKDNMGAWATVGSFTLTYDDTDRGQLKTLTDQEGLVTEYSYDDRGRLMSFKHPNASPAPNFGGDTAQFDYDSSGRITKWAPFPVGVLNQVRDATGRLTSQHTTGLPQNFPVSDENQNIDVQRDALGRRIKTTYNHLGAGVERHAAYDGMDRLVRETIKEKDASGTPVPSHFETSKFDEAGNRVEHRVKGEVTVSAVSEFNQITSETKKSATQVPTGQIVVSTDLVADELDANHTVALINDGATPTTSGNGEAWVSLTTTANHAVILQPSSGSWELFQVDLFFPIDDHGLPQRVLLETWNGSNWVKAKIAGATGAEVHEDVPGSPPLAWNLEPLAGTVSVFLDQTNTTKIRVRQPSGQEPSPPLPGRTGAFSLSEVKVYEALSGAPVNFTYDASGNLTNYGSRALQYDAHNRVTQVWDGLTHLYTLTYGPGGQLLRVRDEVAAADRQRLTWGSEIYAEYDGTGTLIEKYVLGITQDAKIAQLPGGTFARAQYMFPDPHGSTHQLVGLDVNTFAVNVDEVRFYSAWGQDLAVAGTSLLAQQSNPSLPQPARFGFSGRPEIGSSGLLDYRARLYDPKLGRFLNPDPSGTADGLNRYSFVHGDPLGHVDRSGLNGEEEGWEPFAEMVGTAFEFFFGGRADPKKSNVIQMPRGGLGGVTGGFSHVATAGLTPLETYPTWVSVAGMDEGGSRVPLVGSSYRMVYGEEIFSQTPISTPGRVFAGLELAGQVYGTFRLSRAFRFGRVPRQLLQYTGFKRMVSPFRRADIDAPPVAPRAGRRYMELDLSGAPEVYCFVAGTSVETAEGAKAIEDIRVGDLVLSRSERTGETGYRRVTSTSTGQTAYVSSVRIRYRDGNIGELKSTCDHPFYSRTRNRWVRAEHLLEGEELVSSSGEPCWVEAVESTDFATSTYNFEVEGWSSYFVYPQTRLGAGISVWVHNGPGDLNVELDLVPDSSSVDAQFNRNNTTFKREQFHGVQKQVKLPKGHGLVYLRYNPITKGYYVGKADDLANFKSRMRDEDLEIGRKMKVKGFRHTWQIVGTAPAGNRLLAYEDTVIAAGGGPNTKKFGGVLENGRWNFASFEDYHAAGGRLPRHCWRK